MKNFHIHDLDQQISPYHPLYRSEDIGHEPPAATKSPTLQAWNNLEAAVAGQQDLTAAFGEIEAIAYTSPTPAKAVPCLHALATQWLFKERANRMDHSAAAMQHSYNNVAIVIEKTLQLSTISLQTQTGMLSELLFSALLSRSTEFGACPATPREESSGFAPYNHDCVVIAEGGKRAFDVKSYGKGKRVAYPVQRIRLSRFLSNTLQAYHLQCNTEVEQELLNPNPAGIAHRIGRLVVRDVRKYPDQSPTERNVLTGISSCLADYVREAPVISP